MMGQDMPMIILALGMIITMVLLIFNVLDSWETQKIIEDFCLENNSTYIKKQIAFLTSEKYCINKNNEFKEFICYNKKCFFVG